MSKLNPVGRFRTNLEASLLAVQVASGVEDGVNFTWAFVWNVGTCRFSVKGETQMGNPHESESTDLKNGDGTTRSSDEAAVMEVERRGRVVWCC